MPKSPEPWFRLTLAVAAPVKPLKFAGSPVLSTLNISGRDQFQEAQNSQRSHRGSLVLAGNNRGKSQTLTLADALIGHEEEDFIFLDRTAKVSTEFIVLEGSLRSTRHVEK